MTTTTELRRPGHPEEPSSKTALAEGKRLRLVEGAGAPASPKQDIPGTIMFDGQQAMKGYGLNKMCFSFNSAENRKEFLRNEEAYCRKYHLTPEQTAAIKSRNVLKLLEAGGNIYYLAKFAGIFGLNVQDIGAQQTGMSVEEFKRMLVAQGE
jgi:protocatechuate 4,5-dioxygenase alpha chain